MKIEASLQALVAGQSVAGSRLKGSLLQELLDEGLLSIMTHGSRRSFRARDVEALKRFLMDKEERYRLLGVEARDTRSSLAVDTGNSKLLTVRSCPGFPVNSYEPIDCQLRGQPFLVYPDEGSFLFIAAWQQFVIPADVVVIGVENMENFRLIRQQRALFDAYLQAHSLPRRVLFVSRYPQSSDLREWLASIPNPYLHFGDFDLAGIHIFLSEFKPYLGDKRASFLIPADIAMRLHKGSRQRYDDQLTRFEALTSDIDELQQLIDLIHQERKAYDQEGYIG